MTPHACALPLGHSGPHDAAPAVCMTAWVVPATARVLTPEDWRHIRIETDGLVYRFIG